MVIKEIGQVGIKVFSAFNSFPTLFLRACFHVSIHFCVQIFGFGGGTLLGATATSTAASTTAFSASSASSSSTASGGFTNTSWCSSRSKRKSSNYIVNTRLSQNFNEISITYFLRFPSTRRTPSLEVAGSTLEVANSIVIARPSRGTPLYCFIAVKSIL